MLLVIVENSECRIGWTSLIIYENGLMYTSFNCFFEIKSLIPKGADLFAKKNFLLSHRIERKKLFYVGFFIFRCGV